MTNAILVINSGSSSIKFSIFELDSNGNLGAETAADQPIGGAGLPAAVTEIYRWCQEGFAKHLDLAAIGHRVVHGGMEFGAPVRIDAVVLRKLREFIPLAPLHQPGGIVAIETLQALAPGVPQVACFDTGFHRTQPRLAQLYGLPRALTDKGVLRYGFHGLSYQYIAGVLPEEIKHGRVVVAHLGSGASLCALVNGEPVATTMGFTALDGLVMGTRVGSLDPGVVLYLMQHEGMSVAEVEDLLYRRSGLLGVSGLSADMRVLLADGGAAAREAVDLFVYRVVREVGSLAAAMGGVDGLVFTGGIGEHAAPVRDRVMAALGWLGVKSWVIATRENLIIARAVQELLKN